MTKAVLLENDIVRLLNDRAKPKAIKLRKPVKFSVVLDLGKDAFTALSKDPLLQAKITEAASDKYNESMDRLVSNLKRADKPCAKVQKKADRDKVTAEFLTAAQQELNTLKKVRATAAQDVCDEVKKGLEKIQKSFNQKKRELSGAKDTGKTFINTVLGADFLPTVKSVKDDDDQYGDKLSGVDMGSRSLAKELNKVLKEIGTAKKRPDLANSKKAKAAVEKHVHKPIAKVISMQETVARGRAFQEKTATAISEIETFKPKKWKVVNAGIRLGDIATGGGDFESTASALEGIATAVGKELAGEINDRA